MFTFISETEEQTQALAQQIASLLSAGDLLCLSGPLGAGKTVLARALIRALCGDDDLVVPSPTFTLVQNYDTPNAPLWHFDLYRLEQPEELYELGWEEALYDGIVIAEWPERLGALTPPRRLDVTIAPLGQAQRRITITPQGYNERDYARCYELLSGPLVPARELEQARPASAFILAAGKGTRLRPYTDSVPKPMVEVGGKSLISHALDHLDEAGIEKITVNLHYRAAILEAHLQDLMACGRFKITMSHEDDLLDTGGGVKKALDTLAPGPFFIISGDSLWTDGPQEQALARMARFWNPAIMDILILLQPLEKMGLTAGAGDYNLLPGGRARRALDKSGAYMWTSIRLCQKEIFDDTPDGPFSFLELLDRAERAGRLYGLIHDGDWHHISTPADLEAVRAVWPGAPVSGVMP